MADLNSNNLDKNDLAIIILAAGCSSRLGQAKQLVKIHGQSLIEKQCQNALSISSSVHCILGFESEQMAKPIKNLAVTQTVNNNWQQGLASSISVGINNLPDTIEAAMLLLVDQWQLNVDDLDILVRTWQQDKNQIVCASQENSLAFGPPVIFPSIFFNELSQLSQGSGAKHVINNHKEVTKLVNLPQAFVDLDTPEQLSQLQQHFSTVN